MSEMVVDRRGAPALGERVQHRSEQWALGHRTGVVLYRSSGDGEAAILWWLRTPAHYAVLMHPHMVNIGLESVHSDEGRVWIRIVSD